MNPIKLSEFKPNKRNIARMWGDVNSSVKTTARKASYFSCSGHGGYVCNPKDFTDNERKIMGDPTYNLTLAIATDVNGIEWVVAVEYEHSPSRTHSIPFYLTFKEWIKYPMYIFEEDCDWAILTYATGIDIAELAERFTKEEREKTVISTLKQYYPKVLERK